MNPVHYFVMGVSGAGKTTLGRMLATALNLPFIDSDDLHPKSNVEKMAGGQPLTDADRAGWLEAVVSATNRIGQSKGAVVANSALKQAYRDMIQSGTDHPVQWIFLDGNAETLGQRLRNRKDHFMPPALLQSQIDTLEPPREAIHADIAQSPDEMLKRILRQIYVHHPVLGIAGLGVMGRNLSLNLAEKGFRLSLFNRHLPGEEEDVARQFINANHLGDQAQGFDQLEDWLSSMEPPRRLLLMVKSGKAVDELMSKIEPLLKPGDVVMDGGNSYYRDTERRSAYFHKKQKYWMGMGISGGEEGARHGPSLMPGGAFEAYQEVSPMLEAMAARDTSGQPCCTWIGPGGAGHFVKMVHNGIEYGEMQLLAEVYALFRFAMHLEPEAIAELLKAWNNGPLASYLLGITVDILRRKEGDHLLLDLIRDEASQKGTGSWTAITAAELGVPIPTISAALQARFLSAMKTERLEAEQLLGSKYKMPKNEWDTNQVRDAYNLARRINHQQGFHLMAEASTAYDWKLDLSEIARVWTSGCIIRSELMRSLPAMLQDSPFPLMCPEDREEVERLHWALANTLRLGIQAGIPLPCLSASWQYWAGFTEGRSSANLIQAQRDYFGAHTYKRTDDPSGQPHHTDWQNTQET